MLQMRLRRKMMKRKKRKLVSQIEMSTASPVTKVNRNWKPTRKL